MGTHLQHPHQVGYAPSTLQNKYSWCEITHPPTPEVPPLPLVSLQPDSPSPLLTHMQHPHQVGYAPSTLQNKYSWCEITHPPPPEVPPLPLVSLQPDSPSPLLTT